MKPNPVILFAILLTVIHIANTSNNKRHSEGAYTSQGRNGNTGTEYSEYADYAKLHHHTRTLDRNNLPVESREAMNPGFMGTRSNQHKKYQTKSTSANLKLVPNWPDPSKQLGQVAAVDIDMNRNVVVFHRGDRVWSAQTFTYGNVYNEKELGPIQQNPVVVFHATTGAVIEEWGSNLFYLPHGLTIDFENNIWVTDVALHQVFKFSANRTSAKPSLILGQQFVPGSDNNHFCKPTDVAVLSNGDFFVSDGYCNSRIVKFDRTGKKLMEWGRSTLNFAVTRFQEKPPPNNFLVPHALAVDEDNGTLFVADRENGRVQCFNTSTGVFIRQLHSYLMGPRIFSVAYAPVQGGLLYIVNGPSLGNVSIKVDGFVVSLASEELVAYFNSDGAGFQNPHDVAVTKDGSEVYVVELQPFKVWKFVQGNLNISVPVRPSKNENLTSAGNITSISQYTKNPKVSPMATAAAVPSVKVQNGPSRGSIIATIAAIASVITVIIIAATVIILRIRRGCFSRYHSRHPSRWDFHIPSAEGFKLGQFLDRHQGFEKVSTEESDDEGSAGSANESQQSAQFA
ncbi:hypothetical protein R5R35_013863 [Gryllus longicercus]|uniref:peptidylamidoglycolate lyase n=1 Tax=Gryllus longicercus TaxID=2509291 RepID=A0AAN9VLB7_9ORTH